MKLSVSLPEEDVEFLDEYAESLGIPTRSAALHEAVRALRTSRIGDAYARAWLEWDESGHGPEWESTVADGIG
jgi:Arc/MetJ-type ribon-helix-helix transcriptional regulator